jgi:hypothetical protein
MTTIQPTHTQAIEIQMRTLTDKQRLANLSHWRTKYGNEFANRIEAEARKRHEHNKPQEKLK